jgi:hypothetical protein
MKSEEEEVRSRRLKVEEGEAVGTPQTTRERTRTQRVRLRSCPLNMRGLIWAFGAVWGEGSEETVASRKRENVSCSSRMLHREWQGKGKAQW